MNFLAMLSIALFAACSSGGDGVGGGDTPPPTKLATPAPTATIDGTKATVSWPAITNAKSYAYELKKGGSSIGSGHTTSPTYTFTLDDKSVYTFRVKAVADQSGMWLDSEFSAEVKAQLNQLSTPTAKLDEASLTNTAATLTWNSVSNAAAYHYNLYENDSKIRSVEIVDTRLELKNLKENTPYRFEVKAVAEGAYIDSEYSAEVKFTTLEIVTLATPQNLKAVTGGTGATLSWDPVEKAEGYLYELYRGSETTPAKSATITTTQISLTALEQATYRFRVQAVGKEGNSYMQPSPFTEYLSFEISGQSVDLKLPASEQDGVIRAFPTAEGAGMYTTGGRGGKIIHVTNLNDSGKGSLRDAIEQSGARIVVFDVAGIIELKSDLKITKGDLTIAGQTAPGDGICLRYRSLVVDADNVIIRFLRSRPGVTGTNSDDDGLDAMWGRFHQNIILDHCSMSWSTDECSSFYTNRNFTMQWCLLAESLHNAGHTKGSHGYGGIWGGAPASFHHNLLANHDSRNPRFDSPNTYSPNEGSHNISLSERAIDFRNNVVYNFCSFAAYGGEGARLNFVSNYYKWGPGSINGKGISYKDGSEIQNGGKRRSYFYQVDGLYTTGGKTYDEGAAHIYHGNNSNHFDTSIDPSSTVGATLTTDNKQGFPLGSSKSKISPDVTWLSSPLPILYQGTACAVTTHAATDAFNAVLNYAGASLRRDAVDTRNASHTRAGTFEKNGSLGSKNGIIDLPSDVGGYPVYTATEQQKQQAAIDTDGDGIPDYYETILGLDAANAADGGAKTLDPQALYTNFEIYLHYLVKDVVSIQNTGGSYTKLN